MKTLLTIIAAVLMLTITSCGTSDIQREQTEANTVAPQKSMRAHRAVWVSDTTYVAYGDVHIVQVDTMHRAGDAVRINDLLFLLTE